MFTEKDIKNLNIQPRWFLNLQMDSLSAPTILKTVRYYFLKGYSDSDFCLKILLILINKLICIIYLQFKVL